MAAHDQYVEGISESFRSIARTFPAIAKDYHQFLFWFMWINFEWEAADSPKPPAGILKYICDNANDQSIDAFYFDDHNQFIYIVQSKYSREWGTPSRLTYAEMKRTADVAHYFRNGDTNAAVYKMANPECRRLLNQAAKRIGTDKYSFKILLVTNKLGPSEDNFRKVLELSGNDLTDENFEIISRPRLFQLYGQFIEGHHPGLPPHFIETKSDKYLHVASKSENLEAYVCAADSSEIATLLKKFGDRVFERNIRAYQGETDVNRKIQATLRNAPEQFFFRNGGITIFASGGVEPVPPKHGGAPGFRIKDLQIINGQQTAIRLSDSPRASAAALLTIIGPHKEVIDFDDFSERRKVTDIIAARNFQNRISYADLKANEPIQVRLSREFRELGYYYERKKKGWSRLTRHAKALFRLASNKKKPWARIKKEDLAGEVFAMLEDPVQAFQGADYIFREQYQRVFPKKKFNTEYYLAIHLLFARYGYELCGEGESYAVNHVVRILVDDLRLTPRNARKFRLALEDEEVPAVKRAVQRLYGLCRRALRKAQTDPLKPLSFNTYFGKKSKLQRKLRAIFNSKGFASERRKYRKDLARIRDLARTK